MRSLASCLLGWLVVATARPMPLPTAGVVSTIFHAQYGDEGQCQRSGPSETDPCKFCKCVAPGRCFVISPGCAWDRNREQYLQRGCTAQYTQGVCCPQVVCGGVTEQPRGQVVTTAAPLTTTTRTTAAPTTEEPTTEKEFASPTRQPTYEEVILVHKEQEITDEEDEELFESGIDIPIEERESELEQTAPNESIIPESLPPATEAAPAQSSESLDILPEIEPPQATTEVIIPTQLPTTPVSIAPYEPTFAPGISTSEIPASGNENEENQEKQTEIEEQESLTSVEAAPVEQEYSEIEGTIESDQEAGDGAYTEGPLDRESQVDTALDLDTLDETDSFETSTLPAQVEITSDEPAVTEDSPLLSGQSDAFSQEQVQPENLTGFVDESSAPDFDNSATDPLLRDIVYEPENLNYDSSSNYDEQLDDINEQESANNGNEETEVIASEEINANVEGDSWVVRNPGSENEFDAIHEQQTTETLNEEGDSDDLSESEKVEANDQEWSQEGGHNKSVNQDTNQYQNTDLDTYQGDSFYQDGAQNVYQDSIPTTPTYQEVNKAGTPEDGTPEAGTPDQETYQDKTEDTYQNITQDQETYEDTIQDQDVHQDVSENKEAYQETYQETGQAATTKEDTDEETTQGQVTDQNINQLEGSAEASPLPNTLVESSQYDDEPSSWDQSRRDDIEDGWQWTEADDGSFTTHRPVYDGAQRGAFSDWYAWN